MTGFESQITFICTGDLESSTRFYGDLLGLPLVMDQGSCMIFRAAPGAFIGVCRREGTVPPEGVILTLVTTDVEGWYRRLMDAGVEFEKAPTFNPDYDITHCFCRDPAGCLVEIQHFEDPRWKG